MLVLRRHPDHAAPERSENAFVLDAESTWVVEGMSEAVDEVVRDLDPGIWERVAPGVAVLRFGNSVGRFERAGGLGALTVCSGKWTEADYERLLEDLSRIAAALPFAPATASSLPYERTERTPPEVLYHAFVWLRHALLRAGHRDLHDAVAGILRDPHRRLVRTTRTVPVEVAGRVGSCALADVASGLWPAMEHRLGIEVGGRRILPVRIAEDRARHCVDTAENRFVRAFIDECTWVVDRARAQLGHGPGALPPRVRRDCDALGQILGTWGRAALWADVGSMSHFPATSTVLHRRAEYRTVLQHQQMLRLGSRVPLKPEVTKRLLESKDIATLYELWATFAILDEVTRRLGRPAHQTRVVTDHKSATVGWGLVARWNDGTEVAYNATYTRTTGFHGTSRSLRVRPDIAVFLPGGPSAGLHLFDAKFRLEGSLDPDSDEDDTKVKRGDLHKMHAYRDAIKGTRSAWVVYPGAQDAAFLDDGRIGVAAVKGHPVSGVGALALRPDAGRVGVAGVLDALLVRVKSGDHRA